MPVLSTNRGHIDEERVRTLVIRLLESLGKNEKSIWEYYNEMAAVEDNIREVEWRDLADTILVFDGLFAAFLSAFLVFTIPLLQPNSTDIAMDVLVHISLQLSNSTIPSYTPPEFTPSPSSVTVNVFFFLSLALVLIDAFLAMLVKSWLQEFDRGWRKYTVAGLRAQERERRLRGLERWKLAELVALLPILIQSSLLFFCIGLLVLLFPSHLVSAIFSSLALVVGLTFYAFTTYVSILDVYAPFSSPVSRGLTILIDAMQASWIKWCTAYHSPPQKYQARKDLTTRSLLGNNRATHPSRPQDNEAVEKREVVIHSRSQIDPQTYVNVLERLVTTTAEAVENIPVFLELLDQPVRDPTLRPSNIKKWKDLLHITLGLLGDPSTFSDSVARTIARTMMFCYDAGTADKQLSRRLIYLFDHAGSGQIGKHKPLNALFAPYLDYYCGFGTIDHRTLSHTIVSLEPSNAADEELLWMVNTIHRNMIWKELTDQFLVYYESLEFFTAVLTYVSSTEQSRRSQVPLTAAVIYAMHTIKSALDNGGISSIPGPYLLPGTVLTISGTMSMTFYQVDRLDLWSDPCVELASALLQPHTQWSAPWVSSVWMFQLPLISALYIDSTKQTNHTFAKLLKLTDIPDITMSTWEWTDVYDLTKLAGYWYIAHFREPLYQNGIQNSPFQDISYVIIQTIQHSSEITLSVLDLLDTSVKHLVMMTPTSSNSLTRNIFGFLELSCTLSGGLITHHAYEPLNPWVLFHADTLFSQCSILHPWELENLHWADTPEQVHIAKARLVLYDSLESEQHKGINLPSPDPHVLKMFLMSRDYVVCTGAFKWCLNLATASQTGVVHSAMVSISETIGYEWIEHLIHVLCGDFVYNKARSWEFLVAHLIPKWTMLPPSWRNDFALAFLVSNVHPPDMHELAVYQYFAQALKQIDYLQDFLLFFTTLLEFIELKLTWGQLTSLQSWLFQAPGKLENHTLYARIESILETRRQYVENTLRLFTELPMVDSRLDE